MSVETGVWLFFALSEPAAVPHATRSLTEASRSTQDGRAAQYRLQQEPIEGVERDQHIQTHKHPRGR
eukprot:7002187-Prymnesium_polylepis.1